MRYTSLIILLVLCLTLLLLTGCIVNTIIPEIASENLENQENTEKPEIENIEEPVIVDTVEPETEKPQKWSGLGMVLAQTGSDAEYDGWVDTLLSNGFDEFRICPSFDMPNWLASEKAAIVRNVGKSAKYIWGVSSNPAIITAANWSTFRQAILDAAQWAQDNGVYEFQLGNEEELHVDGTTMTIAGIITNLKSIATEVQEIFTNGEVSYTCWQDSIDDWITAGKGDIDILASNVYMGGDGYYGDGWKTKITNLINAFGADETYITEFGPSYSSLTDYSTDEKVQAEAITEMIDYIKASGMTRALYFLWFHPELQMGVLKDDGTYRQLWNQALLNIGPVKNTTVLATTKPNTIALISK